MTPVTQYGITARKLIDQSPSPGGPGRRAGANFPAREVLLGNFGLETGVPGPPRLPDVLPDGSLSNFRTVSL